MSHVEPGPDHRRKPAVDKTPATRSTPARSTGRGRSRSKPTRQPTRRSPTSSAWSVMRSRAAPRRSSGSRFARVYTPAVLASQSQSWAAAAARRWRHGRVALPRSRASGHRLPLRARHLDAGSDRRRPGRRGSKRRAHQRGAVCRGAGPSSAVAFDKTGTLTHGRPVLEVSHWPGTTRANCWSACRARSSQRPPPRYRHPRARRRARHRRPRPRISVVQGKGAAGLIGGREYWLGSHRYLEEREQETPDVHERLEAIAARAGRWSWSGTTITSAASSRSPTGCARRTPGDRRASPLGIKHRHADRRQPRHRRDDRPPGRRD